MQVLLCDNCNRKADGANLPVTWFSVMRVGSHGEEHVNCTLCSVECLIAYFKEWQPKPNPMLAMFREQREE